LGTLCKLVNGDAYRESDWSRSGVPIVRIQNLNDLGKPFNYWTGSLDDRVVINPGDLLLAWSGTPGTSFGAHVWKGQRAVLNQHIFRVDLDLSRIDPGWALFAVNSQLEAMIGRAHGAVGLRHVTRREVESLSIPLPPAAEQKRIATILTEWLTAVERARAATETQLEAAKALPAAYLRAAFSNPQAESWPRRRLAETSRLLPSKSIANDGDAVVQAITTACLTESGFQPRGVKTARMWTADVAECTLSPSEILVARSNTPDLVGRASLFPGARGAVVASDLTIRIRPGESMVPSFLAYYLSFLYTTGYWKERAGGASGSMKKITRVQILAEQIPTPTIAQQTCTSDSINDSMAVAQATCEALEQKLAAINALPAVLLRRAFSGEL
jgi:type I restriction enzyme S subunit